MADWPRIDAPEDEERIIRFKKAFHRCHPNPSQNYGIGSVAMHWWLRVGDWAIGWDACTGWELPDEAFHAAAPDCTHPMHQNGAPTHPGSGGAVDFHQPVPMWEDHPLSQEVCPVTRGPCYLDTGFMLGSEMFDLLRTEGDEAVWTMLRSLLDKRKAEAAAEVVA